MSDSKQASTPRSQAATEVASPKRFRRVMCDECGENPADLPSIRCPGCDAYREHTGAF